MALANRFRKKQKTNKYNKIKPNQIKQNSNKKKTKKNQATNKTKQNKTRGSGVVLGADRWRGRSASYRMAVWRRRWSD